MISVILTSAVWYAVPKGIEYLTTDCQTEPQSKVEHIRETLFDCKSVLEDVICANIFTKFAYKALQIPYSHMWVAILITPGFKKVLSCKNPVDRLLQVAICYSLFSSKWLLKHFIKSPQGIECMTSSWGIRMLNIGIGLDFIEHSLCEGSGNNAAGQMRKVLELQLKPLDAYEFFRAKSKENLLSIIERIKCYKSAEEVNSLLDIVNDRFGVIEEDWLKSLPSQIRKNLLNVCGLVDNRSIVDCLTHKISSTGDLSREWYNSIYARAIAELKIHPQQYGSQKKIEKAIMNAFPIPAAFHEDLTLRSYICPITLEPIRYPVEEPTTRDHQQDQDNPVLYERSAIMNILESNPISPITQKPLTVDQLIPRQDIQDMIEMRLEHYSSNIWNYLEINPFSSNDLKF